jgi:cytoskeleton protein RodZ
VSWDAAIVLQDRRSNLAEGRTMMSSAEAAMRDGHGAPVVASRMGADLRAARERVGCTLADMAAHLRIRLPYLEAIEDGRIADLPGTAYAMGFVRTYAQSLGLDADEISRRFRAEAAEMNRKTELAFPAPVPERGVPAGAVMLLGVLLAVGAYIGWYRLSGERAVPDPVRPVPARLAELVPAPDMTLPSSQANGGVPSAAAVLATLPPVNPPPPVQTGAARPALSPSAAAAAVPDRTAAPGPDAAAPADAGPGQVVLRATADAWVQVRDRQGAVLLNRVLRAGETWPAPVRDGLTLTTGNAGGTELLVDGVATPALGANGAVRRDLPMDAKSIRDGKLAAAPRP